MITDKKKVPTTVKDEKLIQKRREQMVEAAVKLFTEKGFHRTTTREIAKTSGFSIGTLYEYIRSKEDVLYLVCDEIYRQVREVLKGNLEEEVDPILRLKKAMEQYIYVIDQLQDEFLVMYQEAKSLTKEALPYVLNKEEEMTQLFVDFIKQWAEESEVALNDDKAVFYGHHIMVQCQMWTFRRWAIQKTLTLPEFVDLQTEILIMGLQTFQEKERAHSRN